MTLTAKGRFYFGAGTNLGLAPKCDMKHCLTNSKHRHRCKKECSVAFRICQNTFSAGAPTRPRRGTHNASTDSRLERGHPSSYPTPHSTPSAHRFSGSIASEIVFRTAPVNGNVNAADLRLVVCVCDIFCYKSTSIVVVYTVYQRPCQTLITTDIHP